MGFFNWFFGDERNPIMSNGGVSVQEYMDGGVAADTKMLLNLWSGADSTTNLASPIVYTPVAVPRSLVGTPSIQTDDKNTLEVFRGLAYYILDECPIITQTMLITGTAWRWAVWDENNSRVVWEHILDDEITNIEEDLRTGEIAGIWTDKNMQIAVGERGKENVRLERHITKSNITERWTGAVNKVEVRPNPFGFLPIPFSHDAPEKSWRGISIFARPYRTIKDNHEIQRNRDTILARFKPKMIQTVFNLNAWLVNNKLAKQTKDSAGNQVIDKVGRIDPFKAPLFVNTISRDNQTEKTEFIFLPSDATSQHTNAIKDNERRIIIGSGVPELFWGTLATGNAASTDAQARLGVEYIKAIQREMTNPYKQLIQQTLTLLGFMRFEQYQPFEAAWNSLDMLSATQRASVFAAYASAMATMMQSGTLTKQSMLYFSKLFFSEFPHETAEELVESIKEMITDVSSHVGQPQIDVGDLDGLTA
jgi:hypothetical protein